MNALQLASAAPALVVSGFTNAAIFNVDRTDDDAAATACTAAASDCSLRGAILASNANGSAADIINLPAGTYGRSTPYPAIGGGLSIVGAGAATTEINAQGLGRVLHFASQTSSDMVGLVSGVTITGGSATFGAGVTINNYGKVTLRKVTVRDNVVTGSGSGGGVLVFPDALVVEDSTLSGNTAGDSGGALFINTFTSATLKNVTISGNHAVRGSAIYHGSGDRVDVSLTNVTIAANVADPGAADADARAIRNFTGTVTFKNTIVAGNTPGNCWIQTPMFSGTFVSAGHNLDSDGTCGLTGTGDQPGADPLLGPLQNNGGPTFTHALSTGPAIDAGDNFGCPAADQRGEPRPANGNGDSSVVCDMGAYERNGPTTAAGTPTGTTVEVQPVDATTGTAPVEVTFSAVSEGGFTNLATGSAGPANAGFKLGNPPLYYEISTSAVFTPPVEVCIHYSGVSFTNENNLKLFHFEDGRWVNATSSHDKLNDIICGRVGSLSPFAAFEDDVDTVPDPFTFIDLVNVLPNKIQTSNAVTISGINAPAVVTVSGGEYQVVGVTGWTRAAGPISNGQQVQVRHVSAKPPMSTVSTTLTVGGVSDTFTSRTVPKKTK